MASELQDLAKEIEQENEELHKENEELINKQELYDTVNIETVHDELKFKVIARLYKNLSLDQLENLEVTVVNSFKDKKKHYIQDLF